MPLLQLLSVRRQRRPGFAARSPRQGFAHFRTQFFKILLSTPVDREICFPRTLKKATPPKKTHLCLREHPHTPSIRHNAAACD